MVDDEPDVLALMKLLFEGNEFDIVTAKDGLDGYSKAKSCHPDLALIDLVMPGMTGIELLKKLKSEEGTREIPVILFSILNREVDRRMALELGAIGYLSKPCSPQEIMSFRASVKKFLDVCTVEASNVAGRI